MRESEGRILDIMAKQELPVPRLTAHLENPFGAFDSNRLHVVGVLPGEGVGPEVVPVALGCLAILERHSTRRFDLRVGGAIGYPAKAVCGRSLSPEVTDFARDIFAEGGALFCGPGGERFVYEMRRAFDLYCKFTPIEPLPELSGAGAVRAETVAQTNMIAVRENMGGVYQGQWSQAEGEGGAFASHSFSYDEATVRHILGVAIRVAAARSGRMHLVLKPGGVPTISDLWRRCATDMAESAGVELFEQEIDNAVYQLIANPGQFDVLVSPNMFGDVLADCGSLLLASRGLSFSGNFNDAGNAVYQTGHGAARDIAGKGIANPIGQIFSLGMMLRESFDWPLAVLHLRQAVRAVLRDGQCTGDIVTPGCEVLGTAGFGEAVMAQLEAQLAGVLL